MTLSLRTYHRHKYGMDIIIIPMLLSVYREVISTALQLTSELTEPRPKGASCSNHCDYYD